MKTPIWTRFDAEFRAVNVHDNCLSHVTATVTFTSPSGDEATIPAFWDGGRIWRVRFCPNELGGWRYKTACEDDDGLDGCEGAFECAPYEGDNPLYVHGDIRVSDDKLRLESADGTPYFWLGDTAWNGAIHSDEQSWAAYLQDRASKGFTGVQFVTTQWRSAAVDSDGRSAFAGITRIRINPLYFQRLDRRFDALNDFGLVAAPVLLWALGDSPGDYLPEDQRILLARYMVARYGAHHVLWILGGDGDYRGERAEPWRRIGRAVFGDAPRRPVTMHPQGRQWIAEEFRGEPWFGFNCYQSGHGDGEDHLRWLIEGPPATSWDNEPRCPTLNFEPNYENHVSYQTKTCFEAYHVRRAAYWSLLVSPPAGVTYGAHGLWGWHLEERVPIDHPRTGSAPAWHQAIHYEGATAMKRLRSLFDSFDWPGLRPDPSLIAEQPGADDASKFIAAAQTDTGDLAVIYTPVGGRIKLSLAEVVRRVEAEWYDPINGTYARADGVSMEETRAFDTPSDRDWVLILRTTGG